MSATQTMKIVHHHANGHLDWLSSEHQSVNLAREAISILFWKYKRFTFVPPACSAVELKYNRACLSNHSIPRQVQYRAYTVHTRLKDNYVQEFMYSTSSNWRFSPAFYIVPKKIQAWTKVYSNTCSIHQLGGILIGRSQ